MTERWQKELRKLSGVEMPPAVGPRIQDGPTGDKLPARRQRIVAGVVAFAVFGAAGTFAFQALRNRKPTGGLGSGDNSVVVELRSAADMPEARLTFDGVPWKPQLGSTCWGGSGTGHCFDTVSPTFAAKDALPMQHGTELRVIGDASTVAASLLPAGADPYSADPSLFIQLGSVPVRLSAPPGDYFLIVRGTWQQGSEDFYFSITITPPSS